MKKFFKAVLVIVGCWGFLLFFAGIGWLIINPLTFADGGIKTFVTGIAFLVVFVVGHGFVRFREPREPNKELSSLPKLE